MQAAEARPRGDPRRDVPVAPVRLQQPALNLQGRITASLGVSSIRRTRRPRASVEQQKNELLRSADAALYHAKSSAARTAPPRPSPKTGAVPAVSALVAGHFKRGRTRRRRWKSRRKSGSVSASFSGPAGREGSMSTTTPRPFPEERPRRPLPPHPRRRLPRRHGHGAEPGLVSLRRPERPADPGLLLLLRDAARRLQPPEDGRPGVPRGAPAGGPDEALDERHLHRAFRALRRDVLALAIPPTPRRPHVLRRGRRARGREHAQDGLRLEGPQEPRARQGREGHAGPPLQERLPRPLRLHALDDEHGRPAQDPVLPEVRLAAPVLPAALASR